MDLLKPIKKAKKKIKDKFDEDVMINEAAELQTEYDLAKTEKAQWNDKFDREEQTQLGDRKFGNIRSNNTKDDARTVIKVVLMLMEAQIDLSIPDPVFKAVAADDEDVISKLQAEAEYVTRTSDIEKLNSIVERDTKKYGSCIYKTLWNKEYQGGGYKGRVEIIDVHPKNILPASGTKDMDKCECIYHAENETLRACIRKYGEIAKKLPEYGQLAESEIEQVGKDEDVNVNKTDDISQKAELNTRKNDHPLTKYEIVEKWYFDEEGDTCLTIFSDRLILKKLPKFFYRREYDADNEEFKMDEEGNEVLRESEIIKDGYKAGEEYKIEPNAEAKPYIPKTLPFVFQNNIPRDKCVWGISDVEILNDVDQSIKKVIHKHEERMLKGNTKVLYNKNTEEEAAQLLDNDDLNVIGVNDVNDFKVVDFKADDGVTLQYYNLLLDIAQRTVGINNVWQGVNKGEATSGKMAEVLIRQTGEKISIKVNEKNIAYKKIYRLVCDFILAFSDGDRPYRLDSDLQPEYGTFNRHELLRKDSSGNFIYPDWDIEISAEQDFPRSKTFLFDSIIELANGGFLQPIPQNLLVWNMLTKIGFPNSKAILQSLQEQVQQAQEQMQQMQQMEQQPQMDIDSVVQSLPEDMREQFLALPPEEQQAAIQGGQEMMGGTNVQG